MKPLRFSPILLAASFASAGPQNLPLSGGNARHHAANFSGTDASTLVSGEALVTSDRGFLGSKNVQLAVANCRIDCQGGVLVNTKEGQPTTITCLNGHATVSIPEKRGAFVEIQPGQLLLVPRYVFKMPQPSIVRLASLAESHSLIPGAANAPDLAKAISDQEARIRKGKLFISNVTLKGTKATIASNGGSSGADAAAGGGSSSSGSSGSSGGGGGGGGAVTVAAVGGGGHACAA
jgi:uncharacterized membrane protein YgcG